MYYPYNFYIKKFSQENRIRPTRAEHIMRHRVLKGNKTGYRFVRQKPMLNFILDFYCPNLKLCIEVDGSSHNNRSEQDDFRDYILLSELAIKTIRYRNWEVKFNLEGVKIHLGELITNLGSKNSNFYI